MQQIATFATVAALLIIIKFETIVMLLGTIVVPSCNKCNLGMKMTKTIPVIFHNLKGYDSHLLLQELGKFNKKISVIPNNMQTYMSFSVSSKASYFDKKSGKQVNGDWFNLRFIDSFGFMASSLSQLVVDLKQSGLDKFKRRFTRIWF